MYGLPNSVLVAPMPTASTAQILGNNESFEPYTSNMYVRRILSGEFQIVNVHLVQELCRLGLWDKTMKNDIMENSIQTFGSSIQNIKRIPEDVRDLYEIVREVPNKTTIDMAVDRGDFIDQSQSFNIYDAHPSYQKMTIIHFYAWKHGPKTGMYYLRLACMYY